jgi:hypothetical protein
MDWFSQLPPMLNGKGAEDKAAQRVLAALASTANHRTGRNAYPSNAWIAGRAHLSERSVRAALKRLEEGKRIIRDGLGPKGTIRWRMNDQFDCAAGWLPLDAREEHRRELTRERVRQWRARKAEAECVTEVVATAATSENTPEAECVTPVGTPEAECVTSTSVTHSASDELPLTPIKDQPEEITDAAAAPPAAVDVIDAELVEELPGPDGPPLLPIEPPAGELVLKSSTVPAVADLSAAWLLPEPEETGKRKRSAPVDAPRYAPEAWQLPRQPRTPSEWVRELVGLYVEAARSCGFEPSGRQIGQVGKEVRGLVASGNNPVHILAAVRRAAERRGAWVMRAMADVQPGNWSAVRPGKQVVTSKGVVTLPEGATNGHRRMVGIMDAFGLTPTK